jgi:septum formation protein
MNIILGSSSPRRKSILHGLVDSFRVLPPSIDETHFPNELPEAFAVRIADEKCRAILESGAIDAYPALVITADTIVTIDGRIIGKPSDFDDAVNMISELNGRTHRVITALTLSAVEKKGDGHRSLTGCEVTEVSFRQLDRDGIISYLNAIEYHDKAGSYAIQEHGGMIVEGYRGSVSNIIGFPLRLFFSMLVEMGLVHTIFTIKAPSSPPGECK